MGEDNITHLSAKQKETIYKEMLKPLKVKISQISLYDTKTASQFLQVYNEIIENENQNLSELIKAIVELEFNINKYEKSEGKEKFFDERSKVILQSIEDFINNSIELSIDEFEAKFAELKSNYDQERGNYKFEDRDRIERKIHELQASLIMRLVESGKSFDDLQQIISEQDKVGLKIFVLEQINSLRQKDGLEHIANKVNNIVMTDKDAVLKTELWSWLNAAMRGIEVKEQKQELQTTTSTAMIVASEKKNNAFVNWFLRLFGKKYISQPSEEPILHPREEHISQPSEEPILHPRKELISQEGKELPIRERADLVKIENIEWLSRYVPRDLLVELESKRLDEEQMQVDKMYVPNPKTIIYEMFKERENKDKMVKEIRENVFGDLDEIYVEKKQYEMKKIGVRRKIIISQEYQNHMYYMELVNCTARMEVGAILKEKECRFWKYGTFTNKIFRLNDALTYANLLDKIFNSDFEQKLLQEIYDGIINKMSPESELPQLPLYNSLIASYKKLLKEYEMTKLDFEATEDSKRKQFYDKNKFKEQLKQIDGISAEGTQETVSQNQKIADEVKNGEVEQGGE